MYAEDVKAADIFRTKIYWQDKGKESQTTLKSLCPQITFFLDALIKSMVDIVIYL